MGLLFRTNTSAVGCLMRVVKVPIKYNGILWGLIFTFLIHCLRANSAGYLFLYKALGRWVWSITNILSDLRKLFDLFIVFFPSISEKSCELISCNKNV